MLQIFVLYTCILILQYMTLGTCYCRWLGLFICCLSYCDFEKYFYFKISICWAWNCILRNTILFNIWGLVSLNSSLLFLDINSFQYSWMRRWWRFERYETFRRMFICRVNAIITRHSNIMGILLRLSFFSCS